MIYHGGGMLIANPKYALRFIIGALLLWAVAYGTASAGYPKLYSPYSFTVVIPLMLLYEIFGGSVVVFAAAPLVIPILFVAWCFPLVKGQSRIPKRTIAASIALVSLSFVFLALSCSYGVKYQGTLHTVAMYLFNAAFWVALFLVGRKNSRQASFASNYMFHWLLFAWLGWVAFPWLGELI